MITTKFTSTSNMGFKQSSPAQSWRKKIWKNLENISKITFFLIWKFWERKILLEQNAILLVYIRSTRFDQSSPVHPVAESWGGTLSVTDEKGEENPRVWYRMVFTVNINIFIPCPMLSQRHRKLEWRHIIKFHHCIEDKSEIFYWLKCSL